MRQIAKKNVISYNKAIVTQGNFDFVAANSVQTHAC